MLNGKTKNSYPNLLKIIEASSLYKTNIKYSNFCELKKLRSINRNTTFVHYYYYKSKKGNRYQT